MATYGQQQAEKNLEYYQRLGVGGQMRRPSALASPEEKEAYAAQEVRAGRAPSYKLPEDYGGMPTGTTRRAIRARVAWAQQQEYLAGLAEQQRQMEQAQREERRLSIAEQAEQRQQWAQDTKEQRDAAILDQSGKIQASIIGFTRPDGSRSRPININDEDAFERLQSAVYANRLGMEDQATKEIVTQMLKDAADAKQEKIDTELATKDAIAKEKVALAKDLGVYGMSVSDFTKDGKIDFEAANAAIGRAWAEGKEAATEIAETKEQRSAVASKINDAEKELLKVRAREAAAQRRVEARPTVKDFQIELEAAQIERGILEDEVNRLNRMLGGETKKEDKAQQEQPQSFDSVEAAEAANLPKGTIVVIGGRRARID